MQKFKVFASWTVCGFINVNTNSADEARAIAEDSPLSRFNADYVDGSFQVDEVLNKNGEQVE